MDDITSDIIAALVAGDLPTDEARALRDRLNADPETREQAEVLEQLAAFLKEEPSIDVNAAAIRKAERLLAAESPGLAQRLAGKAADGGRTFLAALDFDSRLTPAVVGFRGVAEITQVAFSAEVCEIDLEISPGDDDHSTIRGQIEADDAAEESEHDTQPWTIEFTDDDGRTIEKITTEPDGAFRASLPDGSFTMVCTLGTTRVEAGPLNIP